MKTIYPTEHEEQVALFEWASYLYNQYPVLKLMFAIPNGGLRNIKTAINLKKEGVKAGVPDIFLPFSSKGYHGLFIEMKRHGNKPQDNQIEWMKDLCFEKYKCIVSYNWSEAKDLIIDYIS